MKKEEDIGKINLVLLYTILAVLVLLLLEIALTRVWNHISNKEANIQLVNSEKEQNELDIMFLDYCNLQIAVHERECEIEDEDVAHLSFDNYDTIHIAMWNTPRLDDGTYETFWAKSIYYPQHNCQSPQELYKYLKAFSDNEVKAEKVYLSIDPYEMNKSYYRCTFYDKDLIPYEEYISSTLFAIFEENKQTNFVVVLPSFSVEYLESLGSEIDEVFSSWYTFMMMLHWWDNVSVQYMGAEDWLITNSSNFVSKYELVKEVGTLAITYIYKEDLYQITPPELLEKKELIKELCLASNEYKNAGLSDKKIVFYGDSLFAYYSQSTLAIPGIIQNLTGARCYNLAIGGTTASQHEENSFSEVAASGVGRDAEKFITECNPTDDIIFVILYGVNDYLLNASIEEVAAGLFVGAESLISEYPNSKLLFIAPYFVNETDNEIAYASYVDAIRDVSRGYHSGYLNLYEDSGINQDNEADYLLDGIHPRPSTNYMLAKHIINKLSKIK